ncbi:uncharacterized protein RJT20DRAFT_135745 [Scheffersomyces xylosifermentans]|uniref:uncharacterized protein n=1 Tax=Scheffersomyces xylosifermentans TaxID=1304137 RepID=UPI00315D05B7
MAQLSRGVIYAISIVPILVFIIIFFTFYGLILRLYLGPIQHEESGNDQLPPYTRDPIEIPEPAHQRTPPSDTRNESAPDSLDYTHPYLLSQATQEERPTQEVLPPYRK